MQTGQKEALQQFRCAILNIFRGIPRLLYACMMAFAAHVDKQTTQASKAIHALLNHMTWKKRSLCPLAVRCLQSESTSAHKASSMHVCTLASINRHSCLPLTQTRAGNHSDKTGAPAAHPAARQARCLQQQQHTHPTRPTSQILPTAGPCAMPRARLQSLLLPRRQQHLARLCLQALYPRQKLMHQPPLCIQDKSLVTGSLLL